MKKLSALIFTAFLFVSSSIAIAQQTAIQTQPSSDGNFEIALTEAKQKNDVVTVKAIVKNIGANNKNIVMCYQDVYFIDPKENKKYMSLKDAQDASIAGPVDNTYYCKSGRLDRDLGAGQQAMIWLKFPAPASGASEIDFSFPNFLPLEGVNITK